MKLHNRIVAGMAAGAVLGVCAHTLAGNTPWLTALVVNVAQPVGTVFLRMLLMTVVPLVFASLVLGVVGFGDVRRLGRVGGRTLGYFLLSTTLSIVVGLVLVNTVRPGDGMPPETRDALLENYRTQADDLAPTGEAAGFGVHLLVNLVPRNPLEAAVNMDMLGVIFFSLVFGVALTLIPADRARPMIGVIDALAQVIVRIIDMAMLLAPYGVFALVFAMTARFGWPLLAQLGVYMGVVLAGLLLYAAVGLSVLVRVFGGVSPRVFWKGARTSIVTAFSTSSSSATLPTNIAVAQREFGVPPAIAGFVLPLGATMNMNGTALYEGVTVLFLAQVFGVDLDLTAQLTVAVLAVVTAVGAAGVPGGSLPLMMVVLATVGVPPEGIAIILGVDRLLDMARTTLNVTGDLTAALFVARGERHRAIPSAAATAPAGSAAGAVESPAAVAPD